MKGILQIVVVVTAVIVGLNATKINKCKAKNSPRIKDYEVKLENCTGTDGRCILNRTQTYSFEWTFKAPKNVAKLETAALGSVFNQPVQVTSADDTDACKNIYDASGKQGVCPLKKGKKYTYKKPLKIKKDEIWANINLQFHLLNSNNNSTFTCFGLPVRIQEKKK